MKSARYYRLEIAPLSILPLSRSPLFSYCFSRRLLPGTIVTMPFGKQKLSGVVFECVRLTVPKPHWLKSILSVSSHPGLTKHQLSLARYVSREYFTPLGKVLKHFLPPDTVSKVAPDTGVSAPAIPLRPTRSEQLVLRSLCGLRRSREGFLDLAATDDPYRIFALCLRTAYSSGKQSLVLVPEITLLPPLCLALERYFPTRDIVLLHSQLSKKKYVSAWEHIRSGDARLVLATRQGLFAPYRHLGMILLTEEQDDSYKQWDMSPRYDSRRVAKELSQLCSARFLSSSSTPRCDSLLMRREGRLVPLTPLYPPVSLSPLTLVNLRLERYKKNFSPISETLREALYEALSSRTPALLYIHRQGTNAFSVCGHCRSLFRCSRCDRPLSEEEDGHFRCRSCGYRTNLLPSCPHCGHLSFRSFGFGTKRVEREVARLFPSARLYRVDGETMQKTGSAETLYERIQKRDIDFLIGTQMMLKDPFLSKCRLIAMIDADSLLSFSDFRSDERLIHHIFRARRTPVTPPDGHRDTRRVILQTFHPESTFFQSLQTESLNDLMEKILRERETLLYPPAVRLYAITCREKSEARANASGSQLFQKLHRAIEALPDKNAYRLERPFPPFRIQRSSLFQDEIILRLPPFSALPETLRSLLEKHPRCIIDADPLSLILSS